MGDFGPLVRHRHLSLQSQSLAAAAFRKRRAGMIRPPPVITCSAILYPSAPLLTQHLGCFTELTRPYSMPARDPSATGKLKDSMP
jgi:hypothetical protein